MSVRCPRRQGGLTLIELMVGIVIASLLVLAVFSVMSGFEGRKRSTTSVNDIDQAGNYAAYVLDNWVRSAGSGFSQSAEYAFGCKLHATNGSQTLPRTAALPAPFASVSTGTSNVFRLAPLVIAADQTTPGMSGQSSDVLIVMGGAAGKGEAPAYVTEFPASASLSLKNTLSFSASDLLLLVDQELQSTGVAPCMLSQVSSGFAESASTSLALAGSYYAATIDSVSLASSFTKSAVALNLGNVANANAPNFVVVGVGDNNTLYAYDLLQTTATPLQSVANGVFELHALYGLDTDADGKVDAWVKPTGSYAVATLMSGSAAAAEVLQQIKAVRIGLILRNDSPEKRAVSATSLSLFADLGSSLKYTRSLTSTEQVYRYRTLEITVPLRNTMLLE